MYAFDAFVFDTVERRLTCEGRSLAAPGKALQILEILLQAKGRLVKREIFTERLWGRVNVEDRNLTVQMSSLRRLLDRAMPGAGVIETITGTGYRVVCEVRVLPAGLGGPVHAPIAPSSEGTASHRQPAVPPAGRWVNPRLPTEARAALATYRPRIAEAHFLLVQARALLALAERRPGLKALDLFEQAVALDPCYAGAHAGLSSAYMLMASTVVLRPMPLDLALSRARESAQRALAIDDANGEAWATLGEIKMLYEWDWPGAEADLGRAIALEPNSPTTLIAYGRFLLAIGKFDDAIESMERAHRWEPRRRETLEFLANACWYGGRTERALVALDQAIVMPPPEKRPYFRRMLVFDQLGRHEEAMADRREWLLICGELAIADHLQEIARTQGWRAAMPEWIAIVERANLWPQAAQQLIMAGEPARAIEALERGLAERSSTLAFIMSDPTFRSLHDHPRFRKIARTIGLR